MDSSSAPLHGRRVLVTGASSGIGAATVRACAAGGARVAAAARRAERLEGLAADCGALPLSADLTDEAAARRVVADAADGLGGLDAVVNNAGLMRPSLVADGRVDDWRATFELNVIALLVVTHAALPHLRQANHADLVNVSSQSGRRVASAAAGVYSASKFAVHALSEGLRLELAGSGVRVTVVAPGFVRTELLDDAPPGPGADRLRGRQAEVGLDPGAVAGQIAGALAQPADVHLREIVLAPTAQSS